MFQRSSSGFPAPFSDGSLKMRIKKKKKLAQILEWKHPEKSGNAYPCHVEGCKHYYTRLGSLARHQFSQHGIAPPESVTDVDPQLKALTDFMSTQQETEIPQTEFNQAQQSESSISESSDVFNTGGPVFPETISSGQVFPETISSGPVFPEPISGGPVFPETLSGGPVFPETISGGPVFPETISSDPVFPEPVGGPVFPEPERQSDSSTAGAQIDLTETEAQLDLDLTDSQMLTSSSPDNHECSICCLRCDDVASLTVHMKSFHGVDL